MRRTTTAGSPRRSAPHALPVRSVLPVLLALVVLAGCTSPPAGSPDTPTPQSGEAPRAAALVAPAVRAPVTRVAGRLPDRQRLAVRRQVEELVSAYVLAAFLDPGTPPGERLPGFTAGAARLARTQGAVLSRADLERSGAATVEVLRAEAPVSLLAPRGRPAGATARLDLTLLVTPDAPADEGAGGDRVRLRGRLLLTPVGQDWQVFGFDVRRRDR